MQIWIAECMQNMKITTALLPRSIAGKAAEAQTHEKCMTHEEQVSLKLRSTSGVAAVVSAAGPADKAAVPDSVFRLSDSVVRLSDSVVRLPDSVVLYAGAVSGSASTCMQ